MVVLACFLAVACGDHASSAPTSPQGASASSRPSVASARLTPFAVTLEVDETARITLELFAEDGSSVHHPSDWTVGDPTVAELKGGGSKRRVTGLSGGSTVVVATADGVSDSTTVTVQAEEPAVTSVKLTPASVSVEEGATADVALEVKASDGTTTETSAEWTVEDPSLVELNGQGRTREVKGLNSGRARVIASVEGMADTTLVDVTSSTALTPTVAAVTLTPSSLSLENGATGDVTVTVEASDGTTLDQPADWAVADASVASLDGSGATRTVEGLQAGSTVVVATVDGIADTVDIAVAALTGAPAMPAEVSVTEEDRTDKDVIYRATWSASDDAASYDWSAGSDQGGWTDADSTGGLETTFEAPRSDVDDGSYFCVRAVNAAGESDSRCTDYTVPATSVSGSSGGSGGTSDTTVASVIVLPQTPSIQVGGTVDLTATAKNASGDVVSTSFTWSSLSPAVATVDGSGLVTGQSDGTAGVVAVTTNGTADTSTVTVTAASTGGGSGGAPAVVFDPDLYSSTQELKDDPYGVFSSTELGGNYNLDTQVGYPGGSHSMRYDYVDQGLSNAIHLGRDIPLGQRVKEVWVEVDLRWSSNFLAIQNPPSTQGWTFAHKLIFAAARTQNSENWLTSEGYGVGRWGFMWPGGGGNNPPHGSVLMETPVQDDGTYDYVHTQGFDVADYFDEQWHTVRLHFRHDPGLYEFFVDGVLVGSVTGFTVHPEVAITNILLGRNKDDGIENGTESLWWGKMEIWTQDPGW